MNQYRLTPAAQRDLSSIWNFTEERWDIGQSEKYIREIQAAVERVAEDPERGRAREGVREGYRSYAVGSHVRADRRDLPGARCELCDPQRERFRVHRCRTDRPVEC